MSKARCHMAGYGIFTAVVVVCLSVVSQGFAETLKGKVVSSSPTETLVSYRLPEPELGVRHSPSGEAMTLVKVAGASHFGEVGRPDLPVIVDELEIPRRSAVSASATLLDVRQIATPHWVYPLQPPTPKRPGALQERRFVMDREWYRGRATRSLKAASPVVETQTYIRRGKRYLRVIIDPCSYDPSSKRLGVPSEVRLQLRIDAPELPAAAGPRLGRVVTLSVPLTADSTLDELTALDLNIKTVRDGAAIVVATEEEQARLEEAGYPVRVLEVQQRDKTAGAGDAAKAVAEYPSFADIAAQLAQYAEDFPEVCRLETIGTSVQGRQILAMKVSDNPGVQEDEPEMKFVGGIHGDEIPSVILCLNFLELILNTYETDARMQALVNDNEIWVVPVMNPDGYALGWRSNAAGYDLNRSFPEGSSDSIGTVFDGPAMDLTGRPPETIALMEWSAAQSFVLSATFHSGALVANYPYDNDGKGSTYSPTPDQEEFRWLAETYSFSNVPMWSGGDFTNGVTNGAAWYVVSGGMQDWLYRYTSCFDITMEVSTSDSPSAAEMAALWDDNKGAMIAYLEAARTGIRGVAVDAVDGSPLYASVSVSGRPTKVYSDPDVGDFHRVLRPDTYDVTVTAPGYAPVTVQNVTVTEGETTRVDVSLDKAGSVSGTGIIVVHHADHDAAYAAYRTQKENEKYVVTEVRITGTPTAETVRSQVQAAYAATAAEYVVLLGDIEDVPTFYNEDYAADAEGTLISAHSDLPYALLDSGETFADYLGKDVRLGRISLDSDAELQQYVEKLAAFSTKERHNHLTWVSGGSVDSESDTAEGTHNYVRANYIDPDVYASTLLYRDSGDDPEQLSGVIESGTDMVIYSGHGEIYGWYRYDYDGTDLAGLANSLDTPVVLGHCCLTGSFEVDDCFAEKWLISTARGIAYVGASDNSYWDQDDLLEKSEFEWMSTHPGASVAESLDYGLEKTATTYPAAAEHYYTIYHVFGDPTVSPLGDPLTVRHQALPDTADSTGPYAVEGVVEAMDPIDETTLYWRTDPTTAFTAVPMATTRGISYTADIPGQPYGTRVEYYITVSDTVGRQVASPLTAPTSVHSFKVNLAVTHSPLNNTSDTAGPYTVTAGIEADVPVSATLHWALDDAALTSVTMVEQSRGVYAATIPGHAGGSMLSYYIEASASGATVTDPARAPSSRHEFLVDTSAPLFDGLEAATGGDNRVTLSWSEAADDTPPVTYVIYRATALGGQDFGNPLASTGDLSFVDSTLVSGTSYYYVVRARDSLGNEGINTRERMAATRALQTVYSWPLNTDPGWAREDAWGFGKPSGSGGWDHGYADPDSGYTGTNVFGYNLYGNYTNSMPVRYLTTEVIDCTELVHTQLRFQRWLNVEESAYDQATVEVSGDGSQWFVIWRNAEEVTDNSWREQTFDIAQYADGSDSVRIRWGMGPTDGSWLYSGWNLDDIEIRARPAPGSYPLNTSVIPSAGGAIIMDPPLAEGKTTYTEGTVVTLHADPAAGYRLDGWSGDAGGTDTTVKVVVTEAKTITATFSELPPPDFVTVHSVQVDEGDAFPDLTVTVQVDSDAGISCALGVGDFSISEDGQGQAITGISCSASVYTLTYTTTAGDEDGTTRNVLVAAADPDLGSDSDGTTYTAPLSPGTLTATRSLASCAEPGDIAAVSIALDHSGPAMTSLTVTDSVPAGWTYQGTTSTPAPDNTPAIDATGALAFSWTEPPAMPHTVTFLVAIPADETAVTGCFDGEVGFSAAGQESAASVAGDTCMDVGSCRVTHDADQNGNWMIELSPELTRLIQFYNSGGYHCEPDTEDGYAPGPGATDCTPHSADQNGNWMIELSPELTRMIQFYNSGGYHPEEGTEDGFAPGPPPAKATP